MIMTRFGPIGASGWGMTAGPRPGTPIRMFQTVMTGPGQVKTDVPAQMVIVCSGGKTLEILELQPAGKKRMTAEEFLRGYPIVEGMRFGPDVLS